MVSLVFGALMGVGWNLLNPEITGEVAERGVAVPIAEARQLFDRVAIFSLLGAGIGLALGAVVGVRHRRRPVTALLALAGGGLAGSLLAWRVGVWAGPSLGDEAPGTVVEVPLDLEAPAALLAWPLIAVVVVTVMVLFRDDRAPWVWNSRSQAR